MRLVLFHSALGLRAVERQAADLLRRDGHDVRLPDLYAGATAATLEAGLRLMDTVGWSTITARARRAVQDLPDDTALAGVSMGAGVAAQIWQDRPATPALVLLHGYAAIPDRTVPGTRVAMHLAADDPFAPPDVVSGWLVQAADRGLDVELHRYPVAGHFFTDAELPDHDGPAAELLWRRVRSFLPTVGAP